MGRRREEIFRIDRNPHRVRRFLGHLLLTVLMLALIAGVANFAISRDVALENVYVTVANLPEDLENYSILHLSDLHGATFGERQAGIRNALGSERFSLCVMTGDMLGPEGDTSALEDLLDCLPEGLTTIGTYSFLSCTALRSVQLPETLTFIEDWAFEDCEALTDVNIPMNVIIGLSAFSGCNCVLDSAGRPVQGT